MSNWWKQNPRGIATANKCFKNGSVLNSLKWVHYEEHEHYAQLYLEYIDDLI